jgi:hypothetical protein
MQIEKPSKWVCECGFSCVSVECPPGCPFCDSETFAKVRHIEIQVEGAEVGGDLLDVSLMFNRVGDELVEEERACDCDADCGISCRDCSRDFKERLGQLAQQIRGIRDGIRVDDSYEIADELEGLVDELLHGGID